MLAGLTGNFGSGKSTVLRMFSEAGAVTSSADAIVSDLYKREEIKEKTASILGDILGADGEIDKGKIAGIIFNNKELKEKLEALLHPLVFLEIETLRKKNRGRVVVVEIPLLFEAGREADFDAVILCLCSRETIFRRLKEKGFSDNGIEARLSSQIPDDEKRERADHVIDTDRPLREIEEDVKMVYNALYRRLQEQNSFRM